MILTVLAFWKKIMKLLRLQLRKENFLSPHPKLQNKPLQKCSKTMIYKKITPWIVLYLNLTRLYPLHLKTKNNNNYNNNCNNLSCLYNLYNLNNNNKLLKLQRKYRLRAVLLVINFYHLSQNRPHRKFRQPRLLLQRLFRIIIGLEIMKRTENS